MADPLRLESDSPWKEGLDHDFPGFLALCFADAHTLADWAQDWSSLETELRPALPDAATGTRLADKLVQAIAAGSDEPRLLHVEVQGRPEAGFAHRMHVYNYRAEDARGRPVISLGVLADEDPNWRPTEYVFAQAGCERILRWPVFKLLDWADRLEELEAGPHLFARLVVAHLVAQQTLRDMGGGANGNCGCFAGWRGAIWRR